MSLFFPDALKDKYIYLQWDSRPRPPIIINILIKDNLIKDNKVLISDGFSKLAQEIKKLVEDRTDSEVKVRLLDQEKAEKMMFKK